jgi:hypothetical protein
MDNWNEEKLNEYIQDGIEEGHTLEYKAAKSLARSNKERDEITKDVSAMANASGGTIIYGIAEFNEENKKHLPEKLDPIDRTVFSKEWLEHIIGNIQPRIPNLLIHPINLSSGPNDVAYVVEVPSGSTAHQSTSLKYYRRYNFECLSMKDYEIRDVMNRFTTPDAEVEFNYTLIRNDNGREHDYLLLLKIKNLGNQVIEHFQLQFTFPQFDGNVSHIIQKRDHIDIWASSQREHTIRYRSHKVLFPQEEIDIGREMTIRYKINGHIWTNLGLDFGTGPMVSWTLYADNMTPKIGTKPFEKLQCF